MTRTELIHHIRERGSYLCVGLDTDADRIPSLFRGEPDPVFAFNRAIIDATRDCCVSYKINTAFYEAHGSRGWTSLERTVAYIGEGHLRIADAKRGDIGNTSDQYARAFFGSMPFDAVTVAPYMGEDSVRPFLQHTGKWTIVLGLTSNPGAADFELQTMGSAPLYEKVLTTVSGWGSPDNLMFVIGATRADSFARVRELTPDHFYLVPGVGAQGGSLKEISSVGMNRDVGLLVNVSRGILYASDGPDVVEKAREAALQYRDEMRGYLHRS